MDHISLTQWLENHLWEQATHNKNGKPCISSVWNVSNWTSYCPATLCCTFSYSYSTEGYQILHFEHNKISSSSWRKGLFFVNGGSFANLQVTTQSKMVYLCLTTSNRVSWAQVHFPAMHKQIAPLSLFKVPSVSVSDPETQLELLRKLKKTISF